MNNSIRTERVRNLGPYSGLIFSIVFSVNIYDKYYPGRFYRALQISLIILFIISFVYVKKQVKFIDKKAKHNLIEGISKDPEQYFKANGVYEKVYGNSKSGSTNGEFTGGNLRIENDKLSNSSSTNLSM